MASASSGEHLFAIRNIITTQYIVTKEQLSWLESVVSAGIVGPGFMGAVHVEPQTFRVC